MRARLASGSCPLLETLGLEEAAQLARMHPATLRARAAAGKAPGAKPGTTMSR